MTKSIIAWDLGATKCAAGIVEYDAFTNQLQCNQYNSVNLADTTSLEDLIAQIEAKLGIKMRDADAVCIGAAGQYNGAFLELEGVYPYVMNFAEIAERDSWPPYHVIHDYAPVVCATFTSYMQQFENIKALNSQRMAPFGRRVALGIGTGLGLKDGVLFNNGDFWLGKNEIGHIGIPTPPHAAPFYLARHHEIMHFLQNRSGNPLPVTFETLLSGKGTARLYQFFHPGEDDITPEEVGAKMLQGAIPEVQAAFAWYMGLLVGTTQLIFMPEGGIWITGGVILKNLAVFDEKDFVLGIDASPAYKHQRDQYPLGVLCNQNHALMGSGYYAVKRLIKEEQNSPLRILENA